MIMWLDVRLQLCNSSSMYLIIDSIMDDYLKVKDAFCDSPHMPSLDALKDYCYDLIDVACIDKLQVNRHEHAIQKAQTIQDFAGILFFHLSRWITFDFLDKVVEHFQPGLKGVKDQLDQYKKKLQLIPMQRLEQLNVFQQQQQEETSDSPSLTEIVAKCKLDADGLRVLDLVTERDFLAQQLGIPEYLLQVLSWQLGSMLRVFVTLQELQPLVEPALHRSDVLDSLKTHGIEDAYLRGHSLDSSNLVSL